MALAVVGGVAFVAVARGGRASDGKPAPPGLADVWAAYREDFGSANRTFRGKRLIIEGVVHDLDGDTFWRDPTAVNLEPPPGEERTAYAALREGAAEGSTRFVKGASLRLSCVVEGWKDGAPRFKDCTLAR